LCLEIWLSDALKLAAEQPPPQAERDCSQNLSLRSGSAELGCDTCIAGSGETTLPYQKVVSLEGGPDRERAILQQMAAGSNH
jgi:hypothetical protein